MQELAQVTQHGIALEMAVPIVERLEVVEIDHQDRKLVVEPPRPVELGLESLRQVTPDDPHRPRKPI